MNTKGVVYIKKKNQPQLHVLTTAGVRERGEGGGGGPAHERERNQLGPGNQDRGAPDPEGTARSLYVVQIFVENRT